MVDEAYLAKKLIVLISKSIMERVAHTLILRQIVSLWLSME